MTTPPPTKSDFMAAEEIKELLRGRDKTEQERIVRWVAESLELAFVPRRVDPTPQATEAPFPSSAGSAVSRSTDIRTFVREKQPKSDNQFATVVAYYFRFMAPESDRKETIVSEDLQNAARLAQHGVFPRPDKTLNHAVDQGYLDRAGRGEYRLNAVGENLVSMTLPGTGGEATAKRPRKTKRSKKPARGR